MCPDNKTVLVTGHNGFIGKNLCEALLFNGFAVVGIGRGSSCSSKACFLSYELDVLSGIDVTNIIDRHRPEIIIHLAGSLRSHDYKDIRECIDMSQQGSWNVIDAALKLPSLEKFIFLGSCEEYGSIDVPFIESSQELPNTAYGLAKLSTTRYLQALSRIYDFPSLILRPSVVYGPGQNEKMFLPDLITHLLNNQKFDMSKGDQTRDFVFVDDIVRAILLAIKVKKCNGEIINISSYSPILIKDLAIEVANLVHDEAFNLINYGAKDYRLGESMHYFADNSKSKTLLAWSPQITLAEGIHRTVEWRRLSVTGPLANES